MRRMTSIASSIALDGLGGGPARSAHAGDLVEVAARSKAELEPTIAQDVQRGCRLGQHRRRAQWQVRDVGEERDPARLCEQRCDERQRVEEARLVRMVLDRNQPEAALVGDPCELADAVDRAGVGDDRQAGDHAQRMRHAGRLRISGRPRNPRLERRDARSREDEPSRRRTKEPPCPGEPCRSAACSRRI